MAGRQAGCSWQGMAIAVLVAAREEGRCDIDNPAMMRRSQ
jgi:hypothetical protein